jgi:hypothetical protein
VADKSNGFVSARLAGAYTNITILIYTTSDVSPAIEQTSCYG